MSLELTDQQQHAVDAEPAPRVVDPRSGTAYVLLRADIFERLRALLGDDVYPSDAYPAIDRAFAADWNDPKMDDYDNIPPTTKPRAGWDAAFKKLAEYSDAPQGNRTSVPRFRENC
jgi:hypothetical protein